MKITETTPKSPRTFSLEITERELRLIRSVFGYSACAVLSGVTNDKAHDSQKSVLFKELSDFCEQNIGERYARPL